jgi:L-lactate dehydrogenase complex protein LldE
MHLDGILRRDNAPLHTVHLAEILASTHDEPFTPPPIPAGGTSTTTARSRS